MWQSSQHDPESDSDPCTDMFTSLCTITTVLLIRCAQLSLLTLCLHQTPDLPLSFTTWGLSCFQVWAMPSKETNVTKWTGFLNVISWELIRPMENFSCQFSAISPSMQVSIKIFYLFYHIIGILFLPDFETFVDFMEWSGLFYCN